jgi:hypothetical protein
MSQYQHGRHENFWGRRNDSFIQCIILIIFLYWGEMGARGSVLHWGTMLQAGRSRIRVPMRYYGSGVDLASNRNEYQESSWGLRAGSSKGWEPYRNLWADCLKKMWEPRRLRTLWASTASYREKSKHSVLISSTFHLFYISCISHFPWLLHSDLTKTYSFHSYCHVLAMSRDE